MRLEAILASADDVTESSEAFFMSPGTFIKGFQAHKKGLQELEICQKKL
jgi:hypothetical protein